MVLTTALSIKRDIFLAIGFSEAFEGWGMEDTYLGASAIANGIYIVPELNTITQIMQSADEEYNKKKDLEKNRAIYNKLLNSQPMFGLNISAILNRIDCVKEKIDRLPQKASVIIPVNEDNRLARCLKSLKIQSVNDYEVIVVQNGSTNAKELSMKNGVKYIHIDDANTAKARNVGIEAAQYEIILFIDSDCIAHYAWVEQMVKAMRYHIVVGGKIKNLLTNNWISRQSKVPGDGQNKVSELPFLKMKYIVTANAGFHKKTIKDVSGFDENLKSGEDVDICYRIGGSDFQAAIANAEVWHEERETLLKYFKRFYGYAKYQSALYAKHKVGTRLINPYPNKIMLDGVKKLINGELNFGILKFIEGIGLMLGYLNSRKYGVKYTPWK